MRLIKLCSSVLCVTLGVVAASASAQTAVVVPERLTTAEPTAPTPQPAPNPAAADPSLAHELSLDEAWQQLRNDDRIGREQAVIRLTRANSIPWLESYVRAYERRAPDRESIRRSLSSLRVAQARNANLSAIERWATLIDPSSGATSKREKEAARRTVEVLALSQAVSRLDETRGATLIVRLFRTAPDVWNGVAMHFASGANEASVPTWLELMTSRDVYVRSWAKAALAARRIKTSGDAVQVQSPTTLADVLRVLGEQKRMDAMRVVVSFLGDTRRLVRAAAWQAVGEFQTNAIWALREAYTNRVGNEPDMKLGWSKLREEIVSHSLREETNAVAAGLSAAERALATKAWGTLDRELNQILDRITAPADKTRTAHLCSALGSAYAQSERWQQAATWLQRAKWLNPATGGASEALLQTALGEVSLRKGLVDAHPFERATVLDPSDKRPRERLDDLSSLTTSDGKRWILLAGISLLAAGAIYLLLSRRAPRLAPTTDADSSAIEHEPKSEAA